MTLEGTEARVEALERQIRRMRRAGLALLVLAGAAALMGQMRPGQQRAPKFTESQCFRLVDTRGQTRAELNITESDGPGLTLYDGNKRTRALLTLDNDSYPMLTFYHSELKPAATLGLTEKGQSLCLYDIRSQPRVTLAVTLEGAITIHDGLGRVAWSAPQ